MRSPNTESAYGCYESRVAISGKADQLLVPSKSFAQKMKLDSTDISWIVCPDKQKALPGSPLVRINGFLEGIHVFSENGNAHYVSVHLLKPMLAKAIDKPRPLSELRGPASADTGNKFGLSVDHPFRETSVQLNRLSDACQEFDWIAGDKAQYEQLQECSAHLVKAIKLIEKNQRSDPELIEELQLQTKQIKNLISIAINKFDRASMERMNELATTDLTRPQSNRVVPFFGRVADLEITAANSVLRLVGSKPPVTVGLISNNKRDPLFRGDVIMAFVQIPETPSFKSFKIRGLTIRSTIVDLITRVEVSR